MKHGIALYTAATLLLSATLLPMSVMAEGGAPGYGFAERCDEPNTTLTRLEIIACANEKLRTQERAMLDLVQAVSLETGGVDGETGEQINPIGQQQNQWRNEQAGKCSEVACLSAAYTARIEAIHRQWAEALQ
ncbi:hypothetical protein ALQ04_04081 [Pseudomonas cichorii]|uniref:Lysozyme inhibitor LprI N-terminal domain-containing protein n=1 Tax=Pseudomonas cichorii TaxID=36746 RepID=A0A3M4M1Q0_PSECI|nr:hypothetical protein [Pseudomonas cichorii]RMQ47798.1 hypothetical protein ALQ04_04081 [Pseudomonas cichorii]